MPIPQDVRDAVVSSYYERTMASSDSARARAQAAYGIASAIAAGVVAAGLFGGLGAEPVDVQVLVFSALGWWLVAAGLFLYTVGSPFDNELASMTDSETFVRSVLQAVRSERRTIDRWQRRAQGASIVAAVATVVAFTVALGTGDARPWSHATIVLSASGVAVVRTVCDAARVALRGEVLASDPGGSVVVRLPRGSCGRPEMTLTLSRDAVRALAVQAP